MRPVSGSSYATRVPPGRPSSALANAAALAKRSDGRFLRACRHAWAMSAGTSFTSLRGSGGVSYTCLVATATALSPMNGRRPVSASNSTTPSE